MQRHIPFAFAAILITLAVAGAAHFGWKALARQDVARNQPNTIPAASPDRVLATTRLGASDRPADWTRIDTKDGFAFYAPPGTHLQRLQNKDAAEGRIVGERFDLRYDYGFFSSSLEGVLREKDYSEDRITIDGHVAIIRRATLRSDVRVQPYATATDKSERWFVGLHIPRVEYRPARGAQGAWKALSIDGAAASPEARAEVERMFKTIRFYPLPVRYTEVAPAR